MTASPSHRHGDQWVNLWSKCKKIPTVHWIACHQNLLLNLQHSIVLLHWTPLPLFHTNLNQFSTLLNKLAGHHELDIFHFFHLCLSMTNMTNGEHQGIVAILVRLNHTNHPRNLWNLRSWNWLFLVSFPSSFLMDLKISSLLRGKIEPAISSVEISSY